MGFSLLAVAGLVLGLPFLVQTFSLAARQDRYTHIILILPISGALIVQRIRESNGLVPQLWKPAALMLAIPLLALIWARTNVLGANPDVRLTVAMSALVLWWVLAFLCSFGPSVTRRFCFALLFLFWIVPLPKVVLDQVVFQLQRGSAMAAHALFAIFAVPVVRHGTSLFIPGLELDVAAECSSIRSSLMLMVATMVLAYEFLDSFWRRLLLVFLAVPLAAAKNGLRIFVIAMLGTRVDPAFLEGRLHREGGSLFLLIALGVVTLFLWMLRRIRRLAPPSPAHRVKAAS